MFCIMTPMKILLVEDHYGLAASTKKGLELLGNVVDVAHDGELGLDLALNEEYDVLILDRMLPKLTGLEICKKLRNKGNNSPILLLTALAETKEKVEGLDAGADDYLGKPFAFEELVARVKALSRRKRKKYVQKIQVEDLEFDTQTYMVKRSGKEIPLSKKELSLLEFMMKNVNQVFSPGELVEKVWPFDSDVTQNLAQVYIGYLRKKIDKAFPGKKSLIVTLRGLGYKLTNK